MGRPKGSRNRPKPSAAYTFSDVVWLTGIQPNQLQHVVRVNAILPASTGRGSGHKREYSTLQLVEAKVIASLAQMTRVDLNFVAGVIDHLEAFHRGARAFYDASIEAPLDGAFSSELSRLRIAAGFIKFYDNGAPYKGLTEGLPAWFRRRGIVPIASPDDPAFTVPPDPARLATAPEEMQQLEHILQRTLRLSRVWKSLRDESHSTEPRLQPHSLVMFTGEQFVDTLLNPGIEELRKHVLDNQNVGLFLDVGELIQSLAYRSRHLTGVPLKKW